MTNRSLALVTGASSGIGAAIATELAGRNHDVVLVARREGPMHELTTTLQGLGASATVIAADLAEPGAGRALAATLAERALSIEVLVNNAGFADFGPFVDAELDKIMQMVMLNMATLTELSHELLKPMVERRRGRIMNVASTAAFMPGPLMATYYATKAYVLSLSEAVAHELRGTGVTMTALCPGPTETGFQARADMGDSKLVKGRKIMDAATVAHLGVDAMLAGRPVVITGLKNKLQALSPRFTPRRLLPGIVARAQAPSH